MFNRGRGSSTEAAACPQAAPRTAWPGRPCPAQIIQPLSKQEINTEGMKPAHRMENESNEGGKISTVLNGRTFTGSATGYLHYKAAGCPVGMWPGWAFPGECLCVPPISGAVPSTTQLLKSRARAIILLYLFCFFTPSKSSLRRAARREKQGTLPDFHLR